MNNLYNIGFRIHDAGNIAKLLVSLTKKGTRIKAGKYSYMRYTDTSGAEIWTLLNRLGQIVFVYPHFNTKRKRKIRLTGEIKLQNRFPGGGFTALAITTGQRSFENGEFTLAFEAPDFYTYGKLVFPQEVEVQLTAFAQKILYIGNEKNFYRYQKNEPKWASRSFIPVGLFDPSDGREEKIPEALALFAGFVKDYSVLHNSYTGDSFLWILVDTYGGEIDVVAAWEQMEKLPKIGEVIFGQFSLSGRILSKHQTKPNVAWWKRIFWKNPY